MGYVFTPKYSMHKTVSLYPEAARDDRETLPVLLNETSINSDARSVQVSPVICCLVSA